MTLEKRKIAFIGGGRITEIILTNICRSGLIPKEFLIVSDPDQERLRSWCTQYNIRRAG